MAERPIIFSGPMVRAILDGRKTQTRRVLKPQPELNDAGLWVWPPYGTPVTKRTWRGFCQTDEDGVRQWFTEPSKAMEALPARVGDLLWVRETFMPRTDLDENDTPERHRQYCFYKATSPEAAEDGGHWHSYEGKWRSPIHMPRRLSRITLRVTGVRVQQLQDISEDDTDAEIFGGDFPHKVMPELFPDADAAGQLSLVECFARVWDSINAKRGYPWESNPWVAAISFARATQGGENG